MPTGPAVAKDNEMGNQPKESSCNLVPARMLKVLGVSRVGLDAYLKP